MIGMCVGTAVGSGELHALLGVVLMAAAYWHKIRLEEANLLTAFGPEYERYRWATRALVPIPSAPCAVPCHPAPRGAMCPNHLDPEEIA